MDEGLTPLEQRSKALFGNRHLLAVADAIAKSPRRVDCSSLRVQLSLNQSSVFRILTLLERHGLLEKLYRDSLTSPLHYRLVKHPFWAAVRLLTASVEVA